MNSDFYQRLLALHYVYPKPLNRLKRIMEQDPELERFQEMSLEKISLLLNIQPSQSARLKASFTQALRTPFQQAYEQHKITPISYNHPMYPPSLLDLIDPPAVLYAKGHLELLANPQKIAVIGSRKASHYSQRAMDNIIPVLVEQDIIIVSGLAKGADAMAHQTAIDLGGKTIAVLGSGFLHPYPKENRLLNSLIEEKHLAITEYPPYMLPKKWNFPMRNRIISGLSQGIVVTEAEVKSGTWSTVEHALDHGRDVFAVPGDIFSPLSAGPHKLIAEGAKPVWNGMQIVEEYRQMTAEKNSF